MKTNHQRGFVEPITAYVGSHRDGTRLRTDPEFGGSVTYADGTVQLFRGGMSHKFFSDKAKVGDEIIHVSAGANVHDTTNGKRGVAKRIRGAKKYVRSRIRARANEATKRLATDDEWRDVQMKFMRDFRAFMAIYLPCVGCGDDTGYMCVGCGVHVCPSCQSRHELMCVKKG